jgi:hypothetical protein
MPDGTVDQFDMEIDGDLVDIVQERCIRRRRGSGFGLHRLFFRHHADRQKMRLPQLQGADDGFQATRGVQEVTNFNHETGSRFPRIDGSKKSGRSSQHVAR